MRIIILALLIGFTATNVQSQQDVQKTNKRLAKEFYENLWFSNNTERYKEYFADSYKIHDIGGRDGIEPAITQKEIADFFWKKGNMSGKVDYQIAEGDLVATRWLWNYSISGAVHEYAFKNI